VRLIPFKFFRNVWNQRNECADALRAIMEEIRSESPELNPDPMAPFAYDKHWEDLAIAADKALAKVPSAEERLRRILSIMRD